MSSGPVLSRNMYLSAAQAVLTEASMPLHTVEIIRRALAAGLVITTAKTPGASMNAQLYTHIAKHGDRSPFVQTGKGMFGLREWSAESSATAGSGTSTKQMQSQPGIVQLAQNPSDRIVSEMLAAQLESFDSVRFERALTAAFETLGFTARHVGGPGQTDVILRAPITGAPYMVIVDAKSNKNGKVSDGNINWNSLRDHQKDTKADFIAVVAPGFSGGNLLKRADEYGVTLLTGDEIAELIEVHREIPLGLLELRGVFGTSGRATPAVVELRQIADANRARWRLLRDIVALVRDLPSGAYPDTQNIWLLLSYQRKQSAPSLDDVVDAVAVLASRTVGILKPNNNGGFILTMQVETALRRLQALARAASEAPDTTSLDQPARTSQAPD